MNRLISHTAAALATALVGSLMGLPCYAVGIGDYRAAVGAEPSLLSNYWLEGNASDAEGLHHGVLTGTTAFAAGIGGGSALSLSGTGYVDLGSSTDFHFEDGSGTIEAWIRPTIAGGGANPGWFGTRADVPTHASRYSLHMRRDYSGLDKWACCGGALYGANATLTSGTWNHVAAVFDAGSATFYLNGQPLAGSGSGALGQVLANTNTQIGRSSPTNVDESWVGEIDEVSIYGDALSAASLQAHYFAFQGPPPPPPAAPTLVGIDAVTDGRWRTASVEKPLDGDGDNIYGTEGYVLYQWLNSGFNGSYDPANTVRSLPAYLASVSDPPRGWGGGANANFSTADDPAGGTHNATHGHSGNPGGTITIDRADDDAFRLTIMASNELPRGESFSQFFSVQNGTSDAAIAEHVGDDDVQYFLFDIPAGMDPIRIGFGPSSSDNPGLMGLAFDHPVPEPSSMVLAGFGAMAMLGLVSRRRRTQQ